MATIQDYLSSLVIVAAAAGLLSAFSPLGGGAMKKYVNYAIALAVVLVVISPLKSGINIISSLDDLLIIDHEKNDSKYQKEKDKTDRWILEKSQETIKEGIKTLLYDRFGIQREEAEVSLVLDSSDFKAVVIEKIQIRLIGYAMWQNAREVESYITSLVSCECEVVNG